MTSPKNPSRKSVERFENEGGTTRAGELARKIEGPRLSPTGQNDHGHRSGRNSGSAGQGARSCQSRAARRLKGGKARAS
jgi:hypothetical protein